MGRPDIAVAARTYDARVYKWNQCWSQDAIQAALLGKTREARDLVAARLTAQTTQRFPAFWNPSFDWTPDMDHGGVAMIALQSMLLQVEKDTVRLFPAWPKEWNVSFKLHAPQQTVVECEYRDGRVQRLMATPAERVANVKVMDPQ